MKVKRKTGLQIYDAYAANEPITNTRSTHYVQKLHWTVCSVERYTIDKTMYFKTFGGYILYIN